MIGEFPFSHIRNRAPALIMRSLCLCISAGALTPQSLTALNASIQADGPAVHTLTTAPAGQGPSTIGYTAVTLLNYLSSVLPTIVSFLPGFTPGVGGLGGGGFRGEWLAEDPDRYERANLHVSAILETYVWFLYFSTLR